MSKEISNKSFRITDGRGFHITFPNGVTLSSQFGWGSYCSNRDNEDLMYSNRNTKNMGCVESIDCEIAMWDKEDKWITTKCPHVSGGDIVEGYVPIDKWLKILDWCRTYVERTNQNTKEI